MGRWLLTYSDLITLLMAFFIIMYAMSEVDANKYQAVANSLSVALSGKSMSLLDSAGPSAVKGNSGQQVKEGTGASPQEQGQLDAIKKQIEEFIKTENAQASSNNQGTAGTSTKLSNYIVVTEQERGLVISFKDTLLFQSGSDELNPQARVIITKVGQSLQAIPNYIRVEGHTDNLPIHNSQFQSNWELSVLRATNVVHVLQDDAGISPDRLSTIGYGEYRPLVPNNDEFNRSMNRRVDIVILKKKYDYFEPSTTTTTPSTSTTSTSQ